MTESGRAWTKKRMAAYGIVFLVVILPLVIALTGAIDFLKTMPFGSSDRGLGWFFGISVALLGYLVHFVNRKDPSVEPSLNVSQIFVSIIVGVVLAAAGLLVWLISISLFITILGAFY